MRLQDEAIARISAARDAGARLIAEAGLPVEPPEVALAVERHRWAWRPPVVRLLLVAESHVYTSAEDMALRVRSDLLPPEARHAPTEFVRLVYCLGYGESGVLHGVYPSFRNRGTTQYWKIFGRVAGRNDHPLVSRGFTLQQRLAWKVDVLRTLQQRGIWLLDASLNAIYAQSLVSEVPVGAPAGRQRVPSELTESLHDIWWRHYGQWLIDQNPTAEVWSIGDGPQDLLRRVGVKQAGLIYQPQAIVTNEKREARLVVLDAAVEQMLRNRGEPSG